jgi:hypothetical protein
MPPGVPKWDDLDAERKELFANYMELYAGLVDNIDQNIGRVLDFLEASGQMDNTIIVFSSDNGASAVGGLEGTPNFMEMREGRPTKHPEAMAALRAGIMGGAGVVARVPHGLGPGVEHAVLLLQTHAHERRHPRAFHHALAQRHCRWRRGAQRVDSRDRHHAPRCWM